jgi:hypothetical protein
MLQAADLLSFLRRLHRFSTASHPAALHACYLAACSLLGSDSQRLADDSFQDTQRGVVRLFSISIYWQASFIHVYL